MRRLETGKLGTGTPEGVPRTAAISLITKMHAIVMGRSCG